jgi:hypothetical protein
MRPLDRIELHSIESHLHSEQLFEKELPMSLQTVAHEFVDLCRKGKDFDVMRTMYSPTSAPSTAMIRKRLSPTSAELRAAFKSLR